VVAVNCAGDFYLGPVSPVAARRRITAEILALKPPRLSPCPLEGLPDW
jgi:hypothetical protein